MRRTWMALGLVAFALWHAWGVLAAWERTGERRHAADFASYHYAVKVAAGGGNPYDPGALSRAARQEGTRRAVHPFFYPPPFLLGMGWTEGLSLHAAYRAWFWLDELFALLCALVLWRWWRPLGPAVPVVIAAAVATLTAVPNNHLMGQANLPVLFLVLLGLQQGWRGRDLAAGALVGTACMLKMSPALFVGWWVLHGRWRAVGAACGTAVLLSLASLPLAGPGVQAHFYLEVLPGFASGDYNGLRVPIGLFGNHSVPDLLHRLFPGPGRGLSASARIASTASAVALLGALAWAFRERSETLLPHAAQAATVAVVMLLLPVYTYEHHLVWGIPAVALLGIGLLSGRLPRWWAVPLALAWLGWAFDLATLKDWWRDLQRAAPTAAFLVRELKFAALVALLGLAGVVGWSRGARYLGSSAGESVA